MTKLSLLKKSGLAVAIALTCILAAQASAISPSGDTPFDHANHALSVAVTPEARAQAIAQLEQALADGDGRAAMRLATLALTDLGFAGDLAYERAGRYYDQAVVLGTDGAAVAQAVTLARRGFYQGKYSEVGRQTLAAALPLLERNADSGDKELLWVLGFLETTGFAGKKDVLAGARHLEAAALAGHGQAALWTANRYGTAIPAEPESERRFLAIAAAANIRGAKELLEAHDSRLQARAPLDPAARGYGGVLSTATVSVTAVPFAASQEMPTVSAVPTAAVSGSGGAGSGGAGSVGVDGELAAVRTRLDAATRERDQLRQQLAAAEERLARMARPGASILSASDLAALNRQGLEAVVDGNYEVAIVRFRQAAAANHAPAQSNLGLMYLNATGVPRDTRQAAKLFELAARQGNLTAAENLARIYDFGLGVHQDRSRAIYWYQEADRLGSEFAAAAIARLKSN